MRVLLLLFALVAGVAHAGRNSVGTHALPAGNPVVPGTTISTAWANNTLSDVSTEITNSLDRSGRGAMLAPLRVPVGSASLPSYSFTGDTDSGLYRAGSQDIRLVVDTVLNQKWTLTGTEIAGTLSALGAATLGADLAVDTTTLVVDATNNRVGIGDATPDAGLDIEVTESAAPAVSIRNHSASGHSNIEFYDSAGAHRLSLGYGNASASFFAQKNFIVLGNGYPLVLADGSIQRWVIGATTGHINMTGSTNPSSTTAISNTLTPANLPKAWAYVTAGASPTVNAGFGITSVTCSASVMTVTFAQAFSGSSYAVLATSDTAGTYFSARPSTTTTALVGAYDQTDTQVNLCSSSVKVSLVAFGLQ